MWTFRFDGYVRDDVMTYQLQHYCGKAKLMYYRWIRQKVIYTRNRSSSQRIFKSMLEINLFTEAGLKLQITRRN